MSTIHQQCRETAAEYSVAGNYVACASIAGVVKVAGAVLDQGVV